MPLSAAQLVTQIYVGYFNRAPDAAGLNYWIGRYSAGMTATQIAQSFSVQTEATNAYAYLANPNVASVSTFLTSVYSNLFNRAPDAAGLAYWTGEINAGRSNVGNAIINIINGAQDSGTTLDLTTVTNKMTAGLTWAQAMSNINGAVYNAAAAGSASSIVASVTSAAATVSAAATATNAFFANGGASSVATAATPLTTNVDNISMGPNQTLTADNTGGTGKYVLTAADTITGTGSNNTLRIFSDGTVAGITFTPGSISGVQTMYVNGVSTRDLDVSGVSGLTALQLDVVGSQTTTLAGQSLTLMNTGNGVTTTIASSSDTKETLTLSKWGQTATSTIAITGTKVASVSIASTGSLGSNTNNVTLTNSGAAIGTITVTGAAATTLTTGAGFLTTGITLIDASAMTGSMTATLATSNLATAFKYLGSAGNDSLNLVNAQVAGANLTFTQLNGMTLTGNGGTDTLTLSNTLATSTTAVASTISGWNVLGWDSGNGTVDLSKWTGFTGVKMNGTAGAAGSLTVNNLGAAATFDHSNGTFGGDAITLNRGSGVGGITLGDTLAVTVGSSSAGVTTDGGAETINGYETITITSQGAANTIGNITATASAGGFETLTLVANKALTVGTITEAGNGASLIVQGSALTTVGVVTGAGLIDASASTGGLTMAV